MRILNVGDFNWMTGRERDTANVDLFAIRQKLSRAAIRSGHMVVEFSDRAVRRTAAPLRIKALGRRAANRGFLAMVEEVQPELILLNFADDIDGGALLAARRMSPGVAIADIVIDPLPSPATQARLMRRRDEVDAIFVTTAGEGLRAYAGERSFVAYMPNPVDAAVETGRAFEHQAETDLILPVQDDDPRQIGEAALRSRELLVALGAASPGLRIASPGLEQPRLRGRAYFEALERSRMGLSLSRRNDQPLYASDRMIHMLGSGLATLVDARCGFQAFYGPDEAVFYTDRDALQRAVAMLRADDAQAREIGRRGRDRTFALFEAGEVFQYMLDQLFDAGGSAERAWPTQRWRR